MSDRLRREIETVVGLLREQSNNLTRAQWTPELIANLEDALNRGSEVSDRRILAGALSYLVLDDDPFLQSPLGQRVLEIARRYNSGESL